MKQLILLSIILLLSVSCEKIFLGKDQVNDPENNFELFWKDFDEHYGLFQARGFNWDSIYSVYRPQVTQNTTDTELWDIMKEMITYLDDSHVFLADPTPLNTGQPVKLFVSGSEQNNQTEAEFSADLVQNSYLESSTHFSDDAESQVYFYGKLANKNIGYMYMNGMEISNNDFMDPILEAIGQHDALIIDLRNNHGGSDLTAAAMAGRFADGQHLIYTVQERNGPEQSDFSEKIEYYSGKSGNQHFDKPVIVLTDQITVSAAEVLLLHLNSFPNVTQIGDTTAGDFSDTGMRRFLPNGWQYQYSIFMFLLPDGSSLDGIGHVPDVYIKNTIADISNGTDKVLEHGIQYLFDTYGIE